MATKKKEADVPEVNPEHFDLSHDWFLRQSKAMYRVSDQGDGTYIVVDEQGKVEVWSENVVLTTTEPVSGPHKRAF